MAYNIIRFDDNFTRRTVLAANIASEDVADLMLDDYSEQFPHAYIDILSDAEVANLK